MSKLSLGLYGIHETHTYDHVVYYDNRMVNGPDCLVVMCFETPALLLTHGRMELVTPGDVIVHHPNDLIHHYATPDMEDGFINDWLFVITSRYEDLFRRLNLPPSTLLHTHNHMFIRSYMQELDYETKRMRPLHADVISNVLERMLLHIARFNLEQSDQVSTYSEVLFNLRVQLLGSYREQWNVERMARAVNLSTSYFSIQYRKTFGISPVEDLIRIRINAASSLLRVTNKSLSEIAAETGFQSEYYFSKLFKKRMGLSPKNYRSMFSTIQRPPNPTKP